MFKSDNLETRTGFQAIWTATTEAPTIPIIKSPNYPLDYPNNAEEVKTNKITKSGQELFCVQMQFTQPLCTRLREWHLNTNVSEEAIESQE